MTRAGLLTLLVTVLCIGGCAGAGNLPPAGQVTNRAPVNSPIPVARSAIRVTPAITRAVRAWARAATPHAVCAMMSDNFRFAVGHGRPVATCPSWITAAWGPFNATWDRVIRAGWAGDQLSVVTALGGHVTTLYLVSECGGLKVNSIGTYSMYTAPPSCPG